MHDARIVCELQRLADWRDNRQSLCRLEVAAFDQVLKIRALHELHDQEVQAIDFAEVVNSHDVRVIEFRERTSFPGESFGKVGDFCCIRANQLQRDDTVQT